MTNLIKAQPAEAPPPGNRRYDWAAHADGQFYLWRDEPGETPQESRRAYNRIRLAAREWAARRGGTIESRSRAAGRQVWIAIHLPDGGTR